MASGIGPLAISPNPLNWLGGAAQGAAADAFKAVMIGLWSTGLWLLKLAFSIVDAFTSPDVSAHGPLAGALPTTLWLGGSVAVLMLFVQLGAALVRRDGQSLGRVLLGIGQFGVVWVGFLGIGGALILAAGGLTHAILGSLLHVGSWSQFSVSDSWPRKVDDATAAGVLGICSLLMLIPAAFGYLLVMLIREASLVILLATTPIAAAGLLSDSTKAWFWKSLRWFISALLIAPAAALILGIGVSLSRGVVQGAGTDTVAATGTAVVGCVLVLIGALCPMTLFKLLAFVDPGTGSGAALRQSMSDAGGMSGLVKGGGGGSSGGTGATSAASQGDGAGRSQGEAAAEAKTSSRIASMLGPVGAGIGMVMQAANKASDLSSDVLGSAGVGGPGYAAGAADTSANRGGGAGGGAVPSALGGGDVPTGGNAPGDLADAGPATLPGAGPGSPGGNAGGGPGGGGSGGLPTTPLPGAGGAGPGAGGAGGAGLSEAAVVAL